MHIHNMSDVPNIVELSAFLWINGTIKLMDMIYYTVEK